MEDGEARALEHRYDVEVVALVTSPGHSYWFHSRDPADGVGLDLLLLARAGLLNSVELDRADLADAGEGVINERPGCH